MEGYVVGFILFVVCFRGEGMELGEPVNLIYTSMTNNSSYVYNLFAILFSFLESISKSTS